MRVHVLGGGTPKPDARRFGSSWLVDTGTDRLLFDCGPAATQKLLRHGLAPTDVNHLFFTHHHFDHNADYPCFALSRWDQGADRIPDLRVHGPRPTAAVTERLFGEMGAFRFDVEARVGNPSSQQAHILRGGVLPRHHLAIEVNEVDHGRSIAGDGWSVETARVEHAQPFLDSLAYRVRAGGRDVVISGDLLPNQAFVEFAAGADLLLMMCWDRQATMAAQGLDTAMSGTISAAETAARAGVRRLALVHLNPDLDEAGARVLVQEDVRTAFAGDLVVAEEETVIEV